MKKHLCLLLWVQLFINSSFGQTTLIKGIASDENSQPVQGATVGLKGSLISSTTDSSGVFELKDVPYGDYFLLIQAPGFVEVNMPIQANKPDLTLGHIFISHDDRVSSGDDIPTATLTESDISEDNSSSSVSGVLGASRDAFSNAATYTFSIARFRVRGYDQGYAPTLMNGANMTDLTTGKDMFFTWSGLNDMVRTRENTQGLEPGSNAYGGIAGSSSIDSRAARQRKQLQASFARSNRAYDNRLMISYGSGILKGGWSFAAAFSRRWAKEGYVEGTFYDSWAYFVSVEKEFNFEHSVSFTVFGSPLHNGRQAPATQEMYDLAGTNFYNPVWGYQNGKKRNANVGKSHMPVFIFSHEWKINPATSLETSISRIGGSKKVSGLDWYNATDPRPDFYRRMPSFIALNDPDQAAIAYALLSNNENERQVNWDDLYETNYHSDSTLYNANGISGKTIRGRWANYLVQDRVTKFDKTGFNTTFHKSVNDNVNFTAGFSYQHQVTEYYKEVNDLLGADFYVDLNQYAEQSNIDSIDGVQNDLNNPNRVLYKGDRYGYDYIADITRTTAWGQGVFQLDYFDYFIAGEIGSIRYFREGKYRNGVFSDDSHGKSSINKFVDYSLKAGITYKLNGRNYFFINGAYLTQAPDFEDAYVSPKTRNTLVSDLSSESASTLEGGYLLKAPRLKGRVVFYTTEFRDHTETNSFYHEDFRTFVNYTISQADKRHSGTELAMEANLGKGFSATAVASLNRYIFTTNALATISQDNKDTLLTENEPVYIRNFHVGGTPEKAYTLGISYRAKQFWFVYLNFNMFDDIYIAANPARRTAAAVDLVDNNSGLYNRIVGQEKADRQFTVDLSAGKSWKLNDRFKSLKRNAFVLLNAGVTNLLNNKKFINGGFEQLRFDYYDKNPDKFGTKYFYSYGATFFVSLTLRLN